jgi:hypothetical protein
MLMRVNRVGALLRGRLAAAGAVSLYRLHTRCERRRWCGPPEFERIVDAGSRCVPISTLETRRSPDQSIKSTSSFGCRSPKSAPDVL